MDRSQEPVRNPVRPRVLWGGVALLLAGMFGTGAGLVAHSASVVVSGLVLLAVGGVAAWYGGVLHDLRRHDPAEQEVQAVREGKVEHGVSSQDTEGNRRARRNARAATEQKHRLLAEVTSQPAPPLLPASSLVLLLLGAWSALGVFVLGYPYTVAGQNNELRDLGLGIVLMLAALWLRHVSASVAVAGTCLVVGALQVLEGLLLPHTVARVSGNQVVVGVLVLVVSAATVTSCLRARR
jgi:hypothetical protein